MLSIFSVSDAFPRELAVYRSYQAMLDRCYDPKHVGYPRYGGRGITVCERWQSSFEAFCADMGPHPGHGYSLDRWPNRRGNYEPGNVRWGSRAQQRRNQDRRKAKPRVRVAKPVRERVDRSRPVMDGRYGPPPLPPSIGHAIVDAGWLLFGQAPATDNPYVTTIRYP